jgi:hypothetical protein
MVLLLFAPLEGTLHLTLTKRPVDGVKGLLLAWLRFFCPAVFSGVRILTLTGYFIKLLRPWEAALRPINRDRAQGALPQAAC